MITDVQFNILSRSRLLLLSGASSGGDFQPFGFVVRNVSDCVSAFGVEYRNTAAPGTLLCRTWEDVIVGDGNMVCRWI